MKKLKALILLTIVHIAVSCSQTNEPKVFNSNDWQNWEETENTLFDRFEMAKDLIRTDELMMSDKAEILKLLGEPNSNNKNSINYFLGHTGGGINTGRLTIIFNKDNKAIDFRISEN